MSRRSRTTRSACIVSLAVCIVALGFTSSRALADTMTFQPDPADLYDLDHHKYYQWGLVGQIGPSEGNVIDITGVSLFFDNIRNWDWGSNDLYVHLLDTAPDGVTVGTDNQGGGDYFDSAAYAALGIAHVELVHYEDFPAWPPQDKTYNFSPDEVAAFNTYILNGDDVGLGFDPDCHYWNCGISLIVTYTEAPIPEPATMLLACGGAVPLLLKRRRRKA